jgi:hypothetical protein
MSVHSIDWVSPGAYNIASNPTLAERMLAKVETWASAARARMEEQRMDRARYRISARGSPGLNNHLRRDIGLPPMGTIVDVDLYR